MVVLTVVTTKNPYNVHFEFPLEKYNMQGFQAAAFTILGLIF